MEKMRTAPPDAKEKNHQDIPDIKGIAGDIYNRELELLRQLLQENKRDGSLALADFLVNALENRRALFPKSEASILPTLTALYPVRKSLIDVSPPPPWREKGLTLLPFPKGPKILENKQKKSAKINTAEMMKNYQMLIRQIHSINLLIKSNREKIAAQLAKDLINLTFFTFKTPIQKNPLNQRGEPPASVYERTFADSLPELKAALENLMEKTKN